ncbi:MAG: hypothetical protein AAF657_38720 [Acidobacteriota bacterium]
MALVYLASMPTHSSPILGTLLLTHSSRRVDLERCSVDFLKRRFAAPERLRDRPPFESLPPCRQIYSGALSFFRVYGEGGTVRRVEPLGCIKHRDKIQHAVLIDDRTLWVGFEHRLEVWRLDRSILRLRRVKQRYTVTQRIEHPHLAALHTVEALGPRRAMLSCSASDAVLVVDVETGRVQRSLRLPAELYGEGFALKPERDLRQHYIPDDLQTTHVNAAFPIDTGRRIVVSTLIQGAIGTFELASGAYRELTRGFVGCHGARADAAGCIYFTDSPRGALMALAADGTTTQRYKVESRWLHDSLQILGSIYAFALSDTNELLIVDIDSGELLFRRRFFAWPVEGFFELAHRWPFWVGNSTQALSFYGLGSVAAKS